MGEEVEQHRNSTMADDGDSTEVGMEMQEYSRADSAPEENAEVADSRAQAMQGGLNDEDTSLDSSQVP